MRRSRYRSRLRKRPSGGRSRNVKKTGMNLLSVVVIIGLAVCLGFMTTKYVIYPILLGQEASFDVMLGKIGIGGDDDEKKNDKENNTEKIGTDENTTSAGLEDRESEKENSGGENNEEGSGGESTSEEEGGQAAGSGYGIQFGSFSTEAAANELIEELKASGIEATVLAKDGMFKVIGQLFPDKDSAVSAKNSIDASSGIKYRDAFIVSIE